jgi:MFS family permease
VGKALAMAMRLMNQVEHHAVLSPHAIRNRQSPMEQIDKTAVATGLAGMCTFINIYCTQPLLPLLRETFDASELEVSLTVSATILASALAAPIIGIIAERLGRKRVIVPSLFLLTIPTALAATAHSLRALVLWRLAQGLFVPGVAAVMLAYVSEESPPHKVGHAMSSFVTGNVIGGFLGRFISGAVAARWGWRYAFTVLAAITLIGAVVVCAWLPPGKGFVRVEHRWAGSFLCGRALRDVLLSRGKCGRDADRLVLALGEVARLRCFVGRSFGGGFLACARE